VIDGKLLPYALKNISFAPELDVIVPSTRTCGKRFRPAEDHGSDDFSESLLHFQVNSILQKFPPGNKNPIGLIPQDQPKLWLEQEVETKNWSSLTSFLGGSDGHRPNCK
jgi:hypothetical protein